MRTDCFPYICVSWAGLRTCFGLGGSTTSWSGILLVMFKSVEISLTRLAVRAIQSQSACSDPSQLRARSHRGKGGRQGRKQADRHQSRQTGIKAGRQGEREGSELMHRERKQRPSFGLLLSVCLDLLRAPHAAWPDIAQSVTLVVSGGPTSIAPSRVSFTARPQFAHSVAACWIEDTAFACNVLSFGHRDRRASVRMNGSSSDRHG